ncbi:MAG TPA: hypothetical protein VFD64_17730 [Gemmatimonadaceae bacterium]|nr:hypothetical protein [Gemmatimonadaceae bacterium]
MRSPAKAAAQRMKRERHTSGARMKHVPQVEKAARSAEVAADGWSPLLQWK